MAVLEKRAEITSKYARYLVDTYTYFRDNKDATSDLTGEHSRKSFLYAFQLVGEELLEGKVESLDQIAQELELIANRLRSAQVPQNIAELVAKHEQEVEAREKGDQIKAKQLASEVENEIEKLRIENPKTTQLVYQSEEKQKEEQQIAKETADAADKFIRDNQTKPQTSTKEPATIPEWMEQDFENRIVGAMRHVKIPENRIEEKKEALVSEVQKIKEEGVLVSHRDLEQLIKNTFEAPGTQDKTGIALEQSEVNVLATAILPELVRSSAQTLYPDPFAKTPRPVFRTASPREISEKTKEVSAPKEGSSAELSTSTVNVLFMLTQRPPSYTTRVGDQLGMLAGGKSTQEQNIEQLKSAVFYLETHEKAYVDKNQFYIQQLKDNIQTIANVQQQLQDVRLIPADKLPEVLNDLDSFQQALFRLDPSGKNNFLVPVPQSIQRLQLELFQEQEAVRAENDFYEGQSLASSMPRLPSPQNINRLANFFGKGFNLESAAANGATRGLGSLSSLGGLAKVGATNFLRTIATGLLGIGGGQAAAFVGVAVIGVFVVIGIVYYWQNYHSQSVFLKQTTSSGVSTQSQYIGLTKTVNPSSYQGQLPTQAKYSITITATKGNLSNIAVADVFTVYGESNPPAPSTTLPTVPTTLESGKSVNLEFPLDVATNYNNAIITNTFTVTADVDGGPKGERSTASASLIVGNPNTGCFIFQGNWPEDKKSALLGKIAILSKGAGRMAKLCKDSPVGNGVIMVYGGSGTWAGEVNGRNQITFYDKAFGTSACTLYTLAHESGHVVGNKDKAGIFAKFVHDINPMHSDLGGEHYVSTYTGPVMNEDEDFAEANAIYIMSKVADNQCFGGQEDKVRNMATVWPLHYNFMKTYVFDGFDGF